jgi:glycosyltransferase A (GT-A) superfamily protein (DUF2064 family)
VHRYLVLFARDPGREARAKGFRADGADLFAAFAAGWRQIACEVGARVVIAAPPEDLASWRSRLEGESDEVIWVSQNGGSFGRRVESVVRATAGLGGPAVIVGGDVPPAKAVLREAFEALGRGADAVLSPAADGGVSLLALPASDADLVAAIEPRQRGVAQGLRRRLSARGRSVAFVTPVADVDGRRSLRMLLRDVSFAPALRSLASRILRSQDLHAVAAAAVWRRALDNPCGLRAPPAAA